MNIIKRLDVWFKDVVDKGILDDICNRIKVFNEVPRNYSLGCISDGHHTFDELYEYRMVYNAMLFNEFAVQGKYGVHKSKRHFTGEECFGGGWFIVMANLPTGQVSNHYKLNYWNMFDIPEKEKADEWDGHSPEIAKNRMLIFASHRKIYEGDK